MVEEMEAIAKVGERWGGGGLLLGLVLLGRNIRREPVYRIWRCPVISTTGRQKFWGHTEAGSLKRNVINC